jgi:hypothetical protein
MRRNETVHRERLPKPSVGQPRLIPNTFESAFIQRPIAIDQDRRNR